MEDAFAIKGIEMYLGIVVVKFKILTMIVDNYDLRLLIYRYKINSPTNLDRLKKLFPFHLESIDGV